MFDLVIRGGTVVDGSGLSRFRADVGVVDGCITRIGRIRERGVAEVDADGLIVAPGFIDGHTHMDAQVFWDPLGTCSAYHGVTTVVMGNCGFSLAPASAEDRALVVRNLERAEDISGDAMAAGIDWEWDDFASYLDAIDRVPKAMNYVAQVGHSALRTWVMGERAFDGPASDDDVAAMEQELERALHAGAWGFTTSRANTHETSDDRPVASRLAAWSEVERLVGVMGRTGHGMFELANEAACASPDPAVRAEARGRLRDLAVATGVTVTFGINPSRFNPYWFEMLDLLDETARAGGRMFGQVTCRPVSVLHSFASELPFDRLAEWAPFRALDHGEQERRLRDPEVRRRLVQSAHSGDYPVYFGLPGQEPDYTELFVLREFDGDNPTVAALAAEQGKDPVDVMIDLARENFQQMFVKPAHNDPAAIDRIVSHPRTVMTFSDSGAHVSQIIDASIHTTLISDWVRRRKMLTLEEAVRAITLAPALNWGLADRGLVREGLRADLVVFDEDRVAPQIPRLVHDLPGGARRLVQGCDGIAVTVVGGEVVLREGEHTGALPGQLVRA
jgi:N-acyl-D-aspartate/D-glutamate deacylase